MSVKFAMYRRNLEAGDEGHARNHGGICKGGFDKSPELLYGIPFPKVRLFGDGKEKRSASDRRSP
jgi:hypothetical protein